MVKPARRIKFGGHISYGKIPKEFSDDNVITQIQIHIHDFVNLPHTRGDYVSTDTFKAHGHLWKLWIFPRGDNQSGTDVEYISIFLHYAGDNADTDPVVAKKYIRTKTITQKKWGKRHEYSKEKKSLGHPNFSTREQIIQNDCNEAGTLSITVELQVATEKRAVWFPQLTYSGNSIGTQLFGSIDTADILFIVGKSKTEFAGHTCILSLRAKLLYELVRTAHIQSNTDEDNHDNIHTIVLPDVDEDLFEKLLTFIYTDEVPTTLKDDDATVDGARSILLASDRFGITDLKLYMESVFVEKFLVPATAAQLLLLADAHSCALLKEKTMHMYVTDAHSFMTAPDWKTLQESSKLLTELLVYTNEGTKRYSSFVDEGRGTVKDVDSFDVTSLRERLQQFDLEVDGSRVMLVERWRTHLRTSTPTTTTNEEEDRDLN